MWFASSLLALIVLVWIADLAAFPIVCLLPWRQRPAAQAYLGPLLGTALLMLLATIFGWLGHGYRQWFCAPLTLALPVAGMCLVRRWPSLRRLGELAIFTTLASSPVLSSLLWYDSFSPFNDTFFYLTHGQWLQAHGFLEPAQPTAHHPVWAQVSMFQLGGMRMGASFLLGWLQAGLGRPWSYEIYPLAAALGLVTGALTVGGAVAAVCPGRHLESALAGLAAAASVNGFVSGAACGFFHQTYGLAFLTGAMTLRGVGLSDRGNQGRDLPPLPVRLRQAVPLALCVAAIVWSYPEVSPFLLAALGLSYLFPWPRNRAAWRRCWSEAWPMASVALALGNFEWLRAARAVSEQASAVTGWPVIWEWWEFGAHALGLKTSTYDGSLWPVGSKVWTMIGVGMAVGASAFILGGRVRGLKILLTRRPCTKPRSSALLPTLLLLGFLAVGFVAMRWFVPNPWTVGTGQSWTQARISGWAGPACVAAVVGGTTLLSSRWNRVGRGTLVLSLLLWCGGGMGWNVKRMIRRTEPILHANALNYDSYRVYLDLRKSLAAIPASARIRLNLPETGFFNSKTRLMLAYFLNDRELVGDWSKDPALLANFMPPSARTSAADFCEWQMTYRQPEPVAWKTGTQSDCLRLERVPAVVSGQTTPPP